MVNLHQGISGSVIGSAHYGGMSSCGQVKHECGFRGIWRRESIPPDVDRVNIMLQLSLLAMTEPLES